MLLPRSEHKIDCPQDKSSMDKNFRLLIAANDCWDLHFQSSCTG